jgi:hypothetical protein
MIGSRLTTARFAPAIGMGALGAPPYRPVPGKYDVVTGVDPMTPDKCPKGGLYEDSTLCCVEKGGGRWNCRRVEIAEKGAAKKPPPPTATETTCIRALQIYLVNQGKLSYASTTGQWNAETEAALAGRFPNPRAYPGGPCAMLAMFGLRPESGEPVRAGINLPGIGSVSPGALAIAGIAILGLLVVAMKGRTA